MAKVAGQVDDRGNGDIAGLQPHVVSVRNRVITRRSVGGGSLGAASVEPGGEGHAGSDNEGGPEQRLPGVVPEGSTLGEGAGGVDGDADGLVAGEGLEPSGHGVDGDR